MQRQETCDDCETGKAILSLVFLCSENEKQTKIYKAVKGMCENLTKPTKRRNAMNIATINKMNNKTFSTSVKSFQAACEKAGIVPTKRQASKWRNKTGAAFACK